MRFRFWTLRGKRGERAGEDGQLDGYRRVIRERYLAFYARQSEEMRREGKYPYQGGWRTLEEIRHLQKEMWRQDRALLFDLVVVYLGMAFFALLLYVVLMAILYS